jgi:hypothetical protein
VYQFSHFSRVLCSTREWPTRQVAYPANRELLIDNPTPATYDSITSAAAALPCTASDQLSPYAKRKPNGRLLGKPAPSVYSSGTIRSGYLPPPSMKGDTSRLLGILPVRLGSPCCHRGPYRPVFVLHALRCGLDFVRRPAPLLRNTPMLNIMNYLRRYGPRCLDHAERRMIENRCHTRRRPSCCLESLSNRLG